MEKPLKCTRGFNMKRLGEPHEKLRLLCLFAEHRQLIKDLLHDVGGWESSGICDEHEEYACWHANQPETEEERNQRMKFEEMREMARKRALGLC